MDPDTSMPFPTILETENSQDKLVLTGLGVRTVYVEYFQTGLLDLINLFCRSFLRVQVYSVGAYIAEDALMRLKGKQNVGNRCAISL